MRNILLAVAVLGASTGAAFAGEGNGDPFVYRSPGTTYQGSGMKLRMVDKDPFSLRAPGAAPGGMAAITPSSGAEGAMQTANSLPPGAAGVGPVYDLGGRAAFANADRVQRRP